MTGGRRLAPSAIVAALLVGCTTYTYLETETPAGRVAPETRAPLGRYETIRERIRLNKYASEQTRPYDEVATMLEYKGDGVLVEILGVRTTPREVNPGETITFVLDYAVLAPPETTEVAVTERWRLTRGTRVLAETDPQVQRRKPGGWRTEATVDVPGEAERGTYVIENEVYTSDVRREKGCSFVVE